jgi:hypothetical protein
MMANLFGENRQTLAKKGNKTHVRSGTEKARNTQVDMHAVPSRKLEGKIAFMHACIPHFGKSGTAYCSVVVLLCCCVVVLLCCCVVVMLLCCRMYTPDLP